MSAVTRLPDVVEPFPGKNVAGSIWTFDQAETTCALLESGSAAWKWVRYDLASGTASKYVAIFSHATL